MKRITFIKNLPYVLFMSGILWLMTPYAYASVEDGVIAYENGDYQQARAEWLPYAALGNINALYNLGQLYRTGRGVDVNYSTAEDYYRRAAEKGHVGAERNLGTLHYFGRLGKIDYGQALIWLTKAAVHNDVRSQLMVGTMHFNGYGCQKDSVHAYAWIYLAAQSGLRNAEDSLKKMEDLMTSEQIEQAKIRSTRLTSDPLLPIQTKQTAPQPENSPEKNNAADNNAEGNDAEGNDAEGNDAEGNDAEDNADKFRVQLGAFRTQSAANIAFEALAKKFPKVMETHTSALEFTDLQEKGIFYRLQIKTFGQKEAANDFCTRLKENDQNCYVVKAP